MSEERDAYAARKPGLPGYIAIGSADSQWTGEMLAEWAALGYEACGPMTRAESIAGFEQFAKARATTAQAETGAER